MDALDRTRVLRIEADILDGQTNIQISRKPEVMFDSEYEQTLIALAEQIVGNIALLCAHGDLTAAKQIAKTMGEESGSVIERRLLQVVLNWDGLNET